MSWNTHCQFWDFSFTFCFSEARSPMDSWPWKKLLHKSLKIVHINFVINSPNKLYDITRIISSEDPFVSLGNLQTDPLTQNLLDILSSPPQSQSKFKRKSRAGRMRRCFYRCQSPQLLLDRNKVGWSLTGNFELSSNIFFITLLCCFASLRYLKKSE